MVLALRSEYGARSYFRMSMPLMFDHELRDVLERLLVEQDLLIEQVRGLMVELGGKPRRRSFRRFVGSLVTCCVSFVLGRSIGLRICVDAEWTVARWYGQYRAYFLQCGEVRHAALCAELATTKQRHARVLETWLANSRRGAR